VCACIVLEGQAEGSWVGRGWISVGCIHVSWLTTGYASEWRWGKQGGVADVWNLGAIFDGLTYQGS
jgi:hypothetical protein